MPLLAGAAKVLMNTNPMVLDALQQSKTELPTRANSNPKISAFNPPSAGAEDWF
jgi:hypothetical protein